MARNVVLASPEQSRAAREALLRAVERLPATVEDVSLAARPARLKELAADTGIESIVLVDGDAVLTADAFGGLRRAGIPGPALVGGRAFVGAGQRVGAMFGPSRSGPNPFDLVPLIGPQSDRHFTDLVRGPIDAPQRGALIVSAEFVRALGNVPLDPAALHLDLAVHARAAGRSVLCEPSMTFHAGEDSLELSRALGDLRRYAGVGTWNAQDLHRDPQRLRAAFITRAVRVMGNIRGYARLPYPLLDVLVAARGELARARALRAGVALGATGSVSLCAPEEGDAVRAALARTSDRYLLVVDADALPDRGALEVLVERLERSGRIALALERVAAPYGAALFHCGSIVNARKLRGATIADVIAGAVEDLPRQRLFAATPAGEIVPAVVPVLPGIGNLDAVFVAASKPAVTEQTVRALLGERVDGNLSVVYPAGATTTERLLAVHSSFRLFPDDSDVQLAVGLNRALGAGSSDAVAIVRDDVQLPHGFLERLKDAFRRIPRLGVAVPRVGGADRPESLPDLGYRSSAEMQALYDRRAEAFAREASLLDVATAPVMIVSREALELVGGFDEMFGFSRCGIEDFTRRIRAANYLIACCDDAYAHLFPTDEAGSFVGNLDDVPFLRAAYEKRWAERRGFDPQSDRVPLRDAAGGPEAASVHRAVRVLLPLKNEEEWDRARPLLVAFAATFRVTDPVEIAVGLDGTFGLQTALGALREVLFASGVPMDETLNVSIDFVPDIAEWRDAGENNVRLAGLERDSLLEVPVVDDVAAVRAYLAMPVA